MYVHVIQRHSQEGARGCPPLLGEWRGGQASRNPPCARPKTKKFLSKTSLYSLKYYKIARERKDRHEYKIEGIHAFMYIYKTYVYTQQPIKGQGNRVYPPMRTF